ncbi:MAG: hypothetical protein PHI72_07400 [Atribacterota bacterium]|nr:hypothetical protein [Atribacterota bacterium]MDD5637576.1 hypothetical protein [Atribacterota bacterium]
MPVRSMTITGKETEKGISSRIAIKAYPQKMVPFFLPFTLYPLIF